MIFILSLSFCLVLPIHAQDNKDLIRAIHQVESSGKIGKIIGDNGLALGPLQIHRGCWKDATEFDKSIKGKYEDCQSLEYSILIFNAYQKRYSKFTKGNTEKMARLWNGHIKGINNPKITQRYWEKIKKNL